MSQSTTKVCRRCGQPHNSHAPTCSYARLYPPIDVRFWANVQKTSTCWVWTGCQDNYGYGKIRYQGRDQKAHRISWMLHNGPIPEGFMACHTCDNPSCVNPLHLFLGNHTINALDMASKGRQVFQRRPERATRGEQHYCAKLTAEMVQTIRTEHAHGISLDALALRYGVSKQSIWRAVHYLTWKHI